MLPMRSWGPKATGGKYLCWAFAGVTFNSDRMPLPLDASALTTRVQFLREHQEGAVHRHELRCNHRVRVASGWALWATRSREVKAGRMEKKWQQREVALKTHPQELMSERGLADGGEEGGDVDTRV